MNADDGDLGDLNIVAVAPVRKAMNTAIKPRKNNKYEKRRRRAEQAKKAKADPQWREKGGERERIEEENENTEVKDVEGAEVGAADEVSDEIIVNIEPDTSAELASDLSFLPKKDENSANIVPPDSPSKEVVDDQADKPPCEESAASEDATTVVTPSRRRHGAAPDASILQQQQAHAKYMAEFHARPLELDRRSGAATNKNTASFDSKHLFEDQGEWGKLKLHPRLVSTLKNQFHMDQPTTIQLKAVQAFQSQADSNLAVHSETGSGKTLAYLLPILQSLATKFGDTKVDRKSLGTRCLILCPTRELATQTLSVLERLCAKSFVWLVPGCLSGGDTRKSEKARIRKGLGIVIATPGRLLDHLHKTESLLMGLKGKLEWLVLDEADRLLDMGLGDQVRQIVQRIRSNDAGRSTWWRSVLVSATVTPSVQALAKERMLCGDKNWVWVKASAKDKKRKNDEKETKGESNQISFSESTPRQLAQLHLTVSAKLRLATLVAFLTKRVQKRERVVVFMSTCASVDYHHKLLHAMDPIMSSSRKGDNTEDDTDNTLGIFGSQSTIFRLHGSVPHSQRQQVLSRFGKTPAAILLATDVAARGLNLHEVDWTVQYDPPCEIADYVHRVGRVARAGKAGHSLLMLLPSERGFLDVLETKGIGTESMSAMSLAKTLNEAAALCKDLAHIGNKRAGGGESDDKGASGSKGSRLGEAFCSELQRRLEDCVEQDDLDAKKLAKENSKKDKRTKRPPKRPEGELLAMARDAYMSHIRAYPTKEKCVRHVFSARALHLGHIARSFALKEPPKALATTHRKQQQNHHDDDEQNKPASMSFRDNTVSFGDDDDGDNRFDDEQPLRKKQKNELSSTRIESNKLKNAKALLLANAMKLQTNGMDML